MLKRHYIVGIDEAGRGPLAGPLAVAAVLLKVKSKNEKGKIRALFKGIRDSKRLSERQREKWFFRIRAARAGGLLEYRVSFVSPARIDRDGLTRVTRVAVARLLGRFPCNPKTTRVLLDGLLYAPSVYLGQKTIIRGDEREPLIAAASIVAKVLRDRRMRRCARAFPGYGFDVHKGYGTKSHREAIRRKGPTPLHRKSFLGGACQTPNNE